LEKTALVSLPFWMLFVLAYSINPSVTFPN